MQLVVKIESIPIIKGNKVKDALFRKAQGDFAYNLARGLAHDKFPKEEDNSYLVVIHNGELEECKEKERIFWEEGNLNREELEKHINSMRTTRFIKNNMLKIIDKSQKFRDYINNMKVTLAIVVTTHIVNDMDLKDLELELAPNQLSQDN